MNTINQILYKLIAILFSMTFISMSVSSWGAVIDNRYLANFWYLAYYGIIMILIALALISMLFIINQCIDWYKRSLRSI
jgi:uncharacterized membrane protein